MAENIIKGYSSESDSVKKKRVLKNTIMLYIRMFFLMIIGFITTRVVLHSLGEVDYGLYNAIAGFVALFGMLTGSLNAAISRFITFELGWGDQEKLNKVFSTAVFIQFGMAIIVAILVETVGMWFMLHHMTIPNDRLLAARWVLHSAVINTLITLTFVPYSATIISHENMSIYAYVSILEGIINLLIAYLISIDVLGDRLIFYSCALCVSSLIVNGIYMLYCRRNFEECKLRRIFDKGLLMNIGSFAGWNLFGAVSGILRDQGINILFNIFLGPVINAARGVSNQASGLATRFSQGFMQALNPQITKSYAAGNLEYMYSLVYQGTRMSFALFFLLALPIFIETDFLMGLWLVDVPEHTVAFIRIALLLLFVDHINGSPLVTVMLATGKIRKYQIVVGGLQLLDFPLAYLLLKIGLSPESVMIMTVFIACCCMTARLYMLHQMINFPVKDYLQNVTFVMLVVILLSSIIPTLLSFLLPHELLCNILVCVISIISAAIFIWTIDFTKEERKVLINKMKIRNSFTK